MEGERTQPGGDREYGEFRCTQLREDGTTRLFIDQADPRIRISAAIINAAREGSSPFSRMDGDVLRIAAENRTVAYRVGEYDQCAFTYGAERLD